jgi:hypothetical protein
MLTLDQHVRPRPEVVDTELDAQETVLLNLHNKLYYTLNATGTRIWQGLKKDLTLREISQQLQQEFGVDAQIVDKSVLRLVEELCQQQLAESKGSIVPKT